MFTIVWCVTGCIKPRVNTSQDQLLRLNIGAEPSTLNPILYTDQPSGEVIGLVFSGLLRVNENLEMEPDLCESYVIKDNGRRYIFYLRKNVTWHDGQPFTAADVKFTFDRILDPKTNTVRRSSYLIDNKPITWHIIDPYTIEARLPAPFGPFLVRAAMDILPKHRLEHDNINTTPFNRHPIGTGPFKFQEWKSGQYIRLVRHDGYYDHVPKLDGIILKIIPDSHTAMLALRRQDIHQNQVLPKDYQRYRRLAYLDLYRWYNLNYTYMGFNMKKAPFSDNRFRQAIAHGINQDALVKAVLQDFGRPAYYPSSPVSWAYPHQQDQPMYPYNPAKSHAYLQELGYKLNEKTKIYEKEGKPLRFQLITNQGNKHRERTAEMIQRYLTDIGIEVTIRLSEWSSFIKILNAPQDPKPFDLVILGWNIGIDPDAYTIWHSSQYPNGFNTIGYANARVDALLTKARQLTDPTMRKPIYYDLFSEIAKDLPYVFLYHTESIIGINTRVKGLSKPGPSGLMARIESIYLTP